MVSLEVAINQVQFTSGEISCWSLEDAMTCVYWILWVANKKHNWTPFRLVLYPLGFINKKTLTAYWSGVISCLLLYRSSNATWVCWTSPNQLFPWKLYTCVCHLNGVGTSIKPSVQGDSRLAEGLPEYPLSWCSLTVWTLTPTFIPWLP